MNEARTVPRGRLIEAEQELSAAQGAYAQLHAVRSLCPCLPAKFVVRALRDARQHRLQQRSCGRRSVVFTTHKVNEATVPRGRLIEAHQELSVAQGTYAQLLRAGDALSEAEASTTVDLALCGEDTSQTAV